MFTLPESQTDGNELNKLCRNVFTVPTQRPVSIGFCTYFIGFGFGVDLVSGSVNEP